MAIPIDQAGPKALPTKARTFHYLAEYVKSKFRDKLSRDSNTQAIKVVKRLPWDDRILDEASEEGEYIPDDALAYFRTLRDSDITAMRKHVSAKCKLEFSEHDIARAIDHCADLNEVNPIARHLESLVWDGVQRLDTWLLDYCGASGPSEEIIKKVGSTFLVGMVRRALFPGSKMDYMLILQGRQGIGKSTLCKILAGLPEFFSEELPNFHDSRQIAESYAGRMIVEIGELANFKGGSVEHLKRFITKESEIARPAYGRIPIEIKRTFSLVGTTNDLRFITDGTGWRRYWPIVCKKIDLDGLRVVRDSIMAEAVNYAIHDIRKTYLSAEDEVEYDNFRRSRILIEESSNSLVEIIRECFPNIQQFAEICELTGKQVISVTSLKSMVKDHVDNFKLTEYRKVLLNLGFKPYRTEERRYWELPEQIGNDDSEDEELD